MFERLMKRLDAVALTPASWGAAFLGIVLMRFFFEVLSNPSVTGALASDIPTLVHYTFFYFVALLSATLVLHYFAPAGIRTLKFAIFALPVIWLGPLLDLVISGGEGYGMAYIFRDPARLWSSFLTFFGPFFLRGVTPGIKVEVVIIMIAAAFYVYSATKRAWKTLASAAAAYAVLFVLLALPSIAKLPFDLVSSAARDQAVIEFWQASGAQSLLAQNFLHPSVRAIGRGASELIFNISITRIYYILAAALCALWCAIVRRNTFIAIIKNSRPERVAYYLFLAGVGMAVARHVGAWYASLAWLDYVSLAVLALAIYCAWMFSVGVNDLEDTQIDAVSNRERPLVAGTLSHEDMRTANGIFLSFALFGGYLLGSYALFLLAVFIVAYYIYSASPLRLRRAPILATFLIAVAGLSIIMAGFYAVSADRSREAFPTRLVVLALVSITLAGTVKDVKDIDGDRRGGVTTIPTLFGPGRGVELVGILTGAAFLLVPLILGERILIVPALIAGLAAHFFIIKKPYRELPVFILILLFLACAIVILALPSF